MNENNTGKHGKNHKSNGETEEKKSKSNFGSGLESLALVSQLGLTLAVPVVLGALAGHWIDGKLDTGMIFFLILLCLGIAGGLYGAYNQVVMVVKRKK